MKKTLIALALTALPLAAMAEVTIYGTIKGGVEWTQVDGDDFASVVNANDWGSKIGFKGKETLIPNTVDAIWQVENKVSIDSRSGRNDGWADGETYIGLSTPYGQLRAGHVGDAFDSDDDLNPWDGSGIRVLDDTWSRIGAKHTGIRLDLGGDAFYGFSANVLYSMPDNNNADKLFRDDAKVTYSNLPNLATLPADAYKKLLKYDDDNQAKHFVSAGLGYKHAPSGFFGKYAYMRAGGEDPTAEAHRVTLGYAPDGGNIFVGLGYQATRVDVSTPAQQKAKDHEYEWTNEIAGTASYTIGAITPMVSVAYGFEFNDIDDSDYIHTILGVDYALSKRTHAVANFGWLRSGNAVDSVNGGTGWAPKIDDGTKDEDHDAYSVGVGLVHSF